MKAKALITTAISVLLLIAVIAAGLNAVFTVTLVKTEFSVASADGQAEAALLKKRLDRFVGKSMTFLDLGEVQDEIDAFPCLKADLLEKRFPSTVEVVISEREEVFAVKLESGYAVLGGNGYYLYEKESTKNRSGGDNILLEGISFSAEQGSVASSDELGVILAVYETFEEMLGEVRANVVSMTFEQNEVRSALRLQMKEGIRIEIIDPASLTREKAAAALSDETAGYLVRPDEERVSGRITVVSSGDTVMCDYDFSRE